MRIYFISVAVLIVFSSCSPNQAYPSVTPSPLITFTSSPIPTIILSPTLTPTPTFPPYIHEPFSIIFFRGWDLWIADIGKETFERQLTFESPSMHVVSYNISPDGRKIVYIPYQVETLNSSIKLVDISTGKTEVVLGENDPYNEIRVFWIDNSRIAYANQGLVPTFTTEKVEEINTYIIYDLASKKQVAITEYKGISQSPNGRYWLTCAGFFVCKYTLYDLTNGRTSEIEADINWGGFIDWSRNSKFMLFNKIDSEGGDCTSQLILINTETLQARVVTPEDQNAWDGSFSSAEEYLVYKQTNVIDFNTCTYGSDSYWLMNLKDYKVQKLPIIFDNQTTWDVHWTPDGKRLVFFYTGYRGNDLWSMNIDGSDLKPILSNVMDY